MTLLFILLYFLIGFGAVGIGYTFYDEPVEPTLTALCMIGWPMVVAILMFNFLIMFIHNRMSSYVEWLNKRFFGQSNL